MKFYRVLVLAVGMFLAFRPGAAFAQGWTFGLGLNVGVSKLEGDLPGADLSPLVSGHLKVFPLPYLGLMGELGFASLNSSSHPNPAISNFKTEIVPFELSAVFNFLPFRRINPYIFAGGGGVYWKATGSGKTLQDGLDSFLKTGGGLEYKLSQNFSVNLAAAFRFSLTDAFDQLRQGDENDQVLDVHAGFTFYFHKNRGDRDHDFIPDELDLMPDIPEDRDGYLDHDGIPEKNPNPLALNSGDFGTANGSTSPVVIHHIVTRAEAGRDITVQASVFSNLDLRVVAALYRPIGTPNWNVVRLEDQGGNLFEGAIPGYAVTTDGLEYCVVAVDETLGGIGYSGLPSKPIEVQVSPNGKLWKWLGGTVGAAAVGTASYLILRKQN
ncbi:MAG: porin family protein [Calditrichaeota bacterium]|nr:MAG: porin family protein [Calditrichota bacterium]